jgi:hypothetical protein
MGELDISYATASNLTTNVTDYSVDSKETSDDVSEESDDLIWQNTEWAQQWGYFNSVPELKSALQMKATWVCGKGWTADSQTAAILDHISGWGKDTFDDILWNMEVIKRVGGDAYCEIIKEDDVVINLKPLDPGSMKIVCGKDGRLKEYRQVSKKKGGKDIVFQPEEIFHLSNNRLADQIHGISDISSLASTILADEESFTDCKKCMHRQARPMIVWKLGTDNQAKINAFITKMDAATNKGENIYIPDDTNAVEHEVVQVDVSSNTLGWRNDLRNRFYRAIGLPQVIFGQGQATESGGKVEYLAHEEIFSKDQRFLELQIWNQLNLRIKLVPPTSLLDNLKQDEQSDNNQQLGFMPSDLTAGQGK